MTSARTLTMAELRNLARKNLPKSVFEFIDGGASNERALNANIRDLERIGFAAQILNDASERRQSVQSWDLKRAS